MKTLIATLIAVLLISSSTNAGEVSNDITVSDVVACGLYMQATGDYRMQDLMNKIRAAGISDARFAEVVKAETIIKHSVGRATYMISAKQSCVALGYDF